MLTIPTIQRPADRHRPYEKRLIEKDQAANCVRTMRGQLDALAECLDPKNAKTGDAISDETEAAINSLRKTFIDLVSHVGFYRLAEKLPEAKPRLSREKIKTPEKPKSKAPAAKPKAAPLTASALRRMRPSERPTIKACGKHLMNIEPHRRSVLERDSDAGRNARHELREGMIRGAEDFAVKLDEQRPYDEWRYFIEDFKNQAPNVREHTTYWRIGYAIAQFERQTVASTTPA